MSEKEDTEKRSHLKIETTSRQAQLAESEADARNKSDFEEFLAQKQHDFTVKSVSSQLSHGTQVCKIHVH